MPLGESQRIAGFVNRCHYFHSPVFVWNTRSPALFARIVTSDNCTPSVRSSLDALFTRDGFQPVQTTFSVSWSARDGGNSAVSVDAPGSNDVSRLPSR